MEGIKILSDLEKIMMEELEDINAQITKVLYDDETHIFKQQHYLSLMRRITRAFSDTLNEIMKHREEISAGQG